MHFPAWHARGKCRGRDPEIFFEQDTEHIAVAICVMCPVKELCLTWALEHKKMTQYGVWGGLTEGQRRKAGTKRQRIRCPGCTSENVEQLRNRHEGCLNCGLTWPI